MILFTILSENHQKVRHVVLLIVDSISDIPPCEEFDYKLISQGQLLDEGGFGSVRLTE